MVIGVLGAFAQPTIRRLLSFHIISQIGYMMMGLGVALSPTPFGPGYGLALAILFLIHNQLVKTALLMGGGQVELETGTGKLNELGGLASSKPVLATVFFVAAFALAGIPLTSGFVAKLGLLQATFASQAYVIAGVSLFVSVLTTMSMIRLWQYIFWGKPKRPYTPRAHFKRLEVNVMMVAPAAVLVVLSLAIGIFAEPAVQLAQTAANQALDRQGYIETVAPQELAQGEPNGGTQP
jgi:multicomponent Na+:H+ antiporter subunit D